MTKNDWYEVGDKIKNLVQDAVDTGDFSQLGGMISDVINDTVDGLQDALRDNLGNRSGRKNGGTSDGQTCGGYDQTYSGSTGGTYGRYGTNAGDEYDGTYRGSRERARRAYEQAGGRSSGTYSQAGSPNNGAYGWYGERSERTGSRERKTGYPVTARKKVPGELGSRIMKYLGYGMGTLFGADFLLTIAAVFWSGAYFALGSAGVAGFFCAGSFLLGWNGQKRLGISRRFRRYQEMLGTRTYCKIEELAAGIGEDLKYVRKDLKQMIRRGYFAEGYLDRKETLLITDKATYQQYLRTEEEYEKRQNRRADNGQTDNRASAYGSGTEDARQDTPKGRSDGERERPTSRQSENPTPGQSGNSAAGQGEKQTSAGRENPEKLTPEHQALIEDGQRYIRHIHECNERIPGEEMTEKLNRLELVVTRIFREAGKNPDAVSDLRKMMSYYLPTTQKLLDAYCELDDQPIRGQNIETTRREIEGALDTLNTAFENLLDSLYEEQAWDISSDISVLNTMLAQEGLTKKDFEKKEQKT